MSQFTNLFIINLYVACNYYYLINKHAFADLSDNEDEKHRLSIECNCQKNDRTGKVNHLSSGPSATMASSEAASFSRPKSITVDNTSKGGNKRSTRFVQINLIVVL